MQYNKKVYIFCDWVNKQKLWLHMLLCFFTYFIWIVVIIFAKSYINKYKKDFWENQHEGTIDYNYIKNDDNLGAIYNKFLSLCTECDMTEYSSNYLDAYERYNRVLEYFEEHTNLAYATRMIIKESKREYSYYYHPIFGCIFRDDNPVIKYIEKIKKIIDGLDTKIQKANNFAKELKLIPLCNIDLKKHDFMKRNIIDMPEIKMSLVGKSFNKEKLLKFVVIDVETTGLKASTAEIIEISAIRYIEFEPIEAFSILIKPKKEITDEIIKINGITNEMVKDAPDISEVIMELKKFIGDSAIIGYNILFDLKFLYVNGLDIFENKKIKYYDVYELAKKVYKLESYTLDNVCLENQIFRLDSHRSLSDCYATVIILEDVIEQITE